jgi:hypothetical protein
MKVRSAARSNAALTPHSNCQVVALMDIYPPPLYCGSTANDASPRARIL